MKTFFAIDFETANPKRVSACSLGCVKVIDGNIEETSHYLIKPVGGHAPFQSNIHGIKDEHTYNQPHFSELYTDIKHIFDLPLVAHSMFDKQVLQALSEHFNIDISFSYTDTSSLARESITGVKDYKLKTLNKYFGFPSFNHHDATEDAIACARIYLKLNESCHDETSIDSSDINSEFKVLIRDILADNEVDYKEAYELLYFLEDNSDLIVKHSSLFSKLRNFLSDDILDEHEANELQADLSGILSKS